MSTTTTAMRRLRATRIEVTPTGLGIQQFTNAQIEQATVDSVARAALDGGSLRPPPPR
jgi:aryl-alcohol dehydrogenase-like predicted oxidoreductase